MASSAQEHHLQHRNQQPSSYGAITAPPSTPSTQPISLSTSNAADALSRLLHRLPPTLSLPARLSPRTTSPPIISLSSQINPNDLLSFSSKFGFFQLTDHPIPSQLALSAELESLSLFDLPTDKKQQIFPKNWPLGFDEDDEDDGDGKGVSLCLSTHSPTESSTELKLSSLTEFALALEKLGLEIVEALSKSLGFENPLQDKSSSCPWSSLMWISEGVAGNKPVFNGRFYPYIVALQYQIRCRKHSLLSDSGWVSVSPQVDSVLVTVGDIAQVWSNGRLKKVRGTAVPSLGDNEKSRCISMSLLVTLPLESTISPLLPVAVRVDGDNNDSTTAGGEKAVQSGGEDEKVGENMAVFRSFSFEDYAWRAYHERLLFKDPLDRFRN